MKPEGSGSITLGICSLRRLMKTDVTMNAAKHK